MLTTTDSFREKYFLESMGTIGMVILERLSSSNERFNLEFISLNEVDIYATINSRELLVGGIVRGDKKKLLFLESRTGEAKVITLDGKNVFLSWTKNAPDTVRAVDYWIAMVEGRALTERRMFEQYLQLARRNVL